MPEWTLDQPPVVAVRVVDDPDRPAGWPRTVPALSQVKSAGTWTGPQKISRARLTRKPGIALRSLVT